MDFSIILVDFVYEIIQISKMEEIEGFILWRNHGIPFFVV